MSDMLVKSGDWQTAQKIYENAKRTTEYSSWKYQAVLNDRIKQAENYVALFNSSVNASNETSSARIMIKSEFSCLAFIRSE